jgi:hypothetical protein
MTVAVGDNVAMDHQQRICKLEARIAQLEALLDGDAPAQPRTEAPKTPEALVELWRRWQRSEIIGADLVREAALVGARGENERLAKLFDDSALGCRLIAATVIREAKQ